MTETSLGMKKGSRFLNFIEKGGNALPHPATLFAVFSLIVLFLSWMGATFHWSAIHPATGEAVHAVNLISKEGLHNILLEMVNNYIGFAPLGIVMVALLGIGIAESSGLISAAIRLTVLKAPQSYVDLYYCICIHSV